jgi:hypothetical protein
MNTFEEMTDMLQAYFECEKYAQAAELSNSLCNKYSNGQVSQSNLILIAFSLKCHFYFLIFFSKNK